MYSTNEKNPVHVSSQLFGFQETFFDLQNHKNDSCFIPKYHLFELKKTPNQPPFFFPQSTSYFNGNIFP